jgi:hypothetical protein
MTFAVAPLFTIQSGRWECLNCPAGRTRQSWEESEDFRAVATTHVEVTGHTITLFRGTEEFITGMATTLTCPVRARCRGCQFCVPLPRGRELTA